MNQTLKPIIGERLTFLDIDVQTDLEAIEFLATKMYNTGIVAKEYISSVMEREILFPTAIEFPKIGVAIPHSDFRCCNFTSIAIGKLLTPVTFSHMGIANKKVDVNIIFMLSFANSNFQLKILQRLLEFLQNDENAIFLKTCSSSTDLSKAISDFICK